MGCVAPSRYLLPGATRKRIAKAAAGTLQIFYGYSSMKGCAVPSCGVEASSLHLSVEFSSLKAAYESKQPILGICA